MVSYQILQLNIGWFRYHFLTFKNIKGIIFISYLGISNIIQSFNVSICFELFELVLRLWSLANCISIYK